MNSERFLVTGAHGCIGSWVVHQLVQSGHSVVATDLSLEKSRLRMLLSDAELEMVKFHALDITDSASVEETVRKTAVNRIIHLAGLQVPFCKANPVLGAKVNVIGTVNVFEAVRKSAGQVRGLSYASSIAVLGPASRYSNFPLKDNADRLPETLYGVYKVAGEDAARVYWRDHGISSVGLRPYIVYGVGRDQGLTSDIAKSILATAADRPFSIKFSGEVSLQLARDVADMFILAALGTHQGAATCNLRNDVVTVEEFVNELKKIAPGSEVSCATGNPLPFPADTDDSGLRAIIGAIPHTPLNEAIQQTRKHFEVLVREGRVDLGQLT